GYRLMDNNGASPWQSAGRRTATLPARLNDPLRLLAGLPGRTFPSRRRLVYFLGMGEGLGQGAALPRPPALRPPPPRRASRATWRARAVAPFWWRGPDAGVGNGPEW